MIIAYGGGHNFKATGAAGFIDEVTEDRKVAYYLGKYLSKEGIKAVDVAPEKMTKNEDLEYRVKKANEENADIYLSIHFNADAGTGTEVYYYQKGKEIAERLAARISLELGLKNRGAKLDTTLYKSGLYELRNTKMAAVTIEVCFVDNKKDVEAYLKTGPEKVAKVIAETLLNKTITENTPAAETKDKYGVVTADILNVREGRGTDFKIVGQLKKGTKVKLCYFLNNWWSIDYGPNVAYVSANYIKEV